MLGATDRTELDDKLECGVDACACPDCGMPMSIRLWLRTANCLRCGTSIALEFLPKADPAPLARAPTKLQVAPVVDITAPPVLPSRAKRILRSLHRLLACLLSTIAHLMMLILLALFGWGDSFDIQDQSIDLSVVLDRNEREGGIVFDEALQTVGFDLPANSPVKQAQIEAEQWAEQLAIADPAAAPNLPPIERVEDALDSDDLYRRMLSARDPRIRSEVLKHEGGTNLTEAAVAKALRWMALHQSDDGSWSLDRFHRAGDCNGRCKDQGGIRSDEGGTSLVLQAMLGAGQTHRTGIYRENVSHGLQFLLVSQEQNGALTGRSARQAGMYVHALGTIVLADAYALTGDETIRDPAQRALDYLTAAQHSAGGWRYQPGERGDLSVTGWQLMALHSGRAAGLEVDVRTLARANRYLDQMQTERNGSQYGYMNGHRASPAMSAEGLLSRLYLGWKRDEPGLRAGIRNLTRRHPVNIRDPNIYYWYYATQLLHHWGGREWRVWNRDVADALVTTQVQTGHAAGSWDPNTPHGGQGGRLYMTVLATCTLEVYYRHAPLFRKIRLDR
ncbi:MAG: hypothetical protein ACR2NU_12250 [Aeoliella sp.]